MKWLVKSEEASLTDFGKYPGDRTIDELKEYGIILLDKPSGPSSNQVDAWVKEIPIMTFQAVRCLKIRAIRYRFG